MVKEKAMRLIKATMKAKAAMKVKGITDFEARKNDKASENVTVTTKFP